jgi:signal transduction histidine kinase
MTAPREFAAMSFASAAEHSGPDKLRVVVPIHRRTDRPGRVVTRKRSDQAALKIIALGEMTRGIAHDFRNILCVITSGLNVAERHPGDPEKLESALIAVREGVSRGMKMTDRLLAFARRQELETGPEDLNTLLGKLKVFLDYGAGPGIRIILELAPDLPKCLVDASQFNSAILNLVVNARDAMPNGGIVRIGTTATPTNADVKYVQVRVSDDGVGMSAEVTKKIFDPYFTTKGDNGTGLGVPQVQALMRQVGGYVTVDSVVGRGTSFDLFFPVHEERPAAAADARQQLDRWADEGRAIVHAKAQSAI